MDDRLLVDEIISRLPDWEQETEASGHDSPKYAPNLLNLLADLGLRRGDQPRVDALLAQILRHQDAAGRFQSFSRCGRLDAPVWGALLCDSHIITEVLIRYGFGDTPAVKAALARIALDQTETAQGRAWPCLPHPASGFRGPGRKAEMCPMVTLEALRAFSWLPAAERPAGLLDGARSITRAWLRRGEEKPYMFGHGYTFKVVKWPAFWYSIFWVLDTLSRYPELWRGPAATPEDRRAMAELAACLVAYNVGPDGQVTPKSCYKGFEQFSFGQKKRPSPFATAQVWSVLHRLDDLQAEVHSVDVVTLSSSKGGTGVVIGPR
ncbi:MAG TPA: hypothetical protein VNT75_26595 [Symbiobacteriaceae bacterium]|nr:hypothetical protein [Symbiobacteriaceae bacterium]